MKLRSILIIAVCVVAGISLTYFAFKYRLYIGIPTSVVQQYKSYTKPPFLALYKCLHESQTVYHLVAHTGYTSESYQYNQEGVLIGSSYWSDDGYRNFDSSVDLEKADCQTTFRKERDRYGELLKP